MPALGMCPWPHPPQPVGGKEGRMGGLGAGPEGAELGGPSPSLPPHSGYIIPAPGGATEGPRVHHLHRTAAGTAWTPQTGK